MSDKRDYLVDIYKTEAEKYNKTRDIQWRMNIAIWTLIVLAIVAKGNGNVDFDKISNSCLLCLSFALLGIHIAFIIQIHGSLHRSLTRLHNIAEYLVSVEENPLKWTDFEKSGSAKFQTIWEYLQAGITSILIIIFLSIAL